MADEIEYKITDIEALAYEIASWVKNEYIPSADRWTIVPQIQKVIEKECKPIKKK